MRNLIALIACLLASAGYAQYKDLHISSNTAEQPLTNVLPLPPPVAVYQTIDDLRKGRSTSTTALVVDYYALDWRPFTGRGGGTFRWRAGLTATDDGGHWIVPKDGGGVWERVLNGQTANVMMWGARGDDATDDTLAVSNAVYACELGFSGELLFPMGGFVLTGTTVFGAGVHIRGESRAQSRVLMRADKDVFHSYEADQALRTGVVDYYYDEDLAIEDLTIVMPMNGRDGAALVVKQPGEAFSVRGLHISGGGYGIRAIGMGAPGLRVHDCTIANQYHAAIQVDGFLGTNWCGYGGPMMLLGFSTDHRRPDSDGTASGVFINRAYCPLTIIGMKAEGQYGSGLIRYLYSEGGDGGRVLGLGAVHVSEATYNCGGPPCDFLRLQGDGSGTASAILQNVNPVGVRWLIQDDVTGGHVFNDQTTYLQGRYAPVVYGASTATATEVKARRTLSSPKAKP